MIYDGENASECVSVKSNWLNRKEKLFDLVVANKLINQLINCRPTTVGLNWARMKC